MPPALTSRWCSAPSALPRVTRSTRCAACRRSIGATTDRASSGRAGCSSRSESRSSRTTPLEAELAKLLTNTWRYMKFAIANQFFQIAHRSGSTTTTCSTRSADDYPRAADLPGPGFAAGPCLLKDTMQLAAFTPDHFPIGQAAMLINEGLPNYIVDTLNSRHPLSGRTVGILGMAFKAESDDPRTSLSYKLRKLAAFKGAQVLCTDPYVRDADLRAGGGGRPRVRRSDRRRARIAPTRKPRARTAADVVDIWGTTGPRSGCEGPGHRLGRVHRRLPGRRAARGGSRGGRARQLQQVRPRQAELRQPSRLPARPGRRQGRRTAEPRSRRIATTSSPARP